LNIYTLFLNGTQVINQHHWDNKDTSMSGGGVLLTDKEAVEQLVSVMKKRFENQ